MGIDRQKVLARMGRSAGWYTITNRTGPTATIRIYEEIGYWGVTEEDFARELDEVTADNIEVQISSPGGDAFAGIAIYNALRAHPARVTTRVDSMAASAASVIVQAGDHRVMLSASQLMIHDAWGLVIGSADEMRSFADVLDKQSDIIAGIYADRSGKDTTEFRALMADETWLSDQEAIDLGLADELVNPPRQAPEDRRKLSEHIDAVVTDADKLTERIAEVVTLRSDQGKPLDESWRTRAAVDQLASMLDNLRGALEEPSADDHPETPPQDDDAATEYLRALRRKHAS